MTFVIILLFVSLLIAFGILYRRVWQMRTARIVMNTGVEEADWSRISIETIKTRLIELAKIGAHLSLLFALKIWIKTAYALKKVDKWVRVKIMNLLHHNGHYGSGGKPSRFLEHISKHKSSLPSQQGEVTK